MLGARGTEIEDIIPDGPTHEHRGRGLLYLSSRITVSPCCWMALVWWSWSDFITFPFPHLSLKLLSERQLEIQTELWTEVRELRSCGGGGGCSVYGSPRAGIHGPI